MYCEWKRTHWSQPSSSSKPFKTGWLSLVWRIPSRKRVGTMLQESLTYVTCIVIQQDFCNEAILDYIAQLNSNAQISCELYHYCFERFNYCSSDQKNGNQDWPVVDPWYYHPYASSKSSLFRLKHHCHFYTSIIFQVYLMIGVHTYNIDSFNHGAVLGQSGQKGWECKDTMRVIVHITENHVYTISIRSYPIATTRESIKDQTPLIFSLVTLLLSWFGKVELIPNSFYWVFSPT